MINGRLPPPKLNLKHCQGECINWHGGQWHYAEAEQRHTMFTIKFGELPGSRMYTMKQLSGVALYVSVRPERTAFVHI